jgi:hypothetical protein
VRLCKEEARMANPAPPLAVSSSNRPRIYIPRNGRDEPERDDPPTIEGTTEGEQAA